MNEGVNRIFLNLTSPKQFEIIINILLLKNIVRYEKQTFLYFTQATIGNCENLIITSKWKLIKEFQAEFEKLWKSFNKMAEFKTRNFTYSTLET